MKQILILHSGSDQRPDEADTLAQVQSVASILKELNIPYSTLSIEGIDQFSLIKKLEKIKPDLVFNLVESFLGSDSKAYLVAALLDYLQIAYSGCKSNSLTILSDKLLTKQILFANNIPTSAWLDEDAIQSDTKINESYILKSAKEHGSIGISPESIVSNKTDLQKLFLQKKNQYGGKWFAEKFIDGREISTVIISKNGKPLVLPLYELIFDQSLKSNQRILDYATKWEEDSPTYEMVERQFDFATHDQLLIDKLKATALTAWNLLEMNGYGRIDFRIDKDGQAWIIDVNPNPCLEVESSGFMAAANKGNISNQQAIQHIITNI